MYGITIFFLRVRKHFTNLQYFSQEFKWINVIIQVYFHYRCIIMYFRIVIKKEKREKTGKYF